MAILILLAGGVVSFAQRVPAPEEILGFKVGADFHLATYQQAIEYFRALEKASPMIKLFEIGKTSMGKPMIYAVITSAENMTQLDRFKEISNKLALVEGLTDEDARRLAAEGKAIVYIDGGLHASECAPAQHNIQLAYDLLTSEDPDIRFILDQTILVLVFANPDGMDMLAEWYQPNVGTPY
ncbi:MAG: M14 family zinc carboxypeptidase, partial [Candidatus Aminicenantes bacterium]|nr:M14 family zinc carboxypeptidase [Candidatus Aminicenantes bacterium]